VAGTFTPGPLDVDVSDRVEYEIVVTNTGNVALTVQLDDPNCRIRGGATLHVTGVQMTPGQKLTYHCAHVIVAGDRPLYGNTVTATGVSGSATVSASSSVVAKIRPAGVKAAQKAISRPKPAAVKAVTKTAKPAKKVVKAASFTG